MKRSGMVSERAFAHWFLSAEWSIDTRTNCLCLSEERNRRCQAKNAQGVAAQHARKHGHCVCVEVCVARIYNHEKA